MISIFLCFLLVSVLITHREKLIMPLEKQDKVVQKDEKYDARKRE